MPHQLSYDTSACCELTALHACCCSAHTLEAYMSSAVLGGIRAGVPDPSPHEARRGQARRHVWVGRQPPGNCLCVGGGLAGESRLHKN